MDISTSLLYIFIFLGLYFQIFLLVTFLEKPKKIAGSKSDNAMDDTKYPTVSITVPCFNEARTLEGTIQSLLALDYPKNKLNILIVDDGSTDTTFEIAQKMTQFPQVSAVRQENGGKYTALNRGIQTSTSDLIGCLDADSFVDSQALKEMIPLFRDQKVAVVIPAMRVFKPKNILQLMQKSEYNLGVFAKLVIGKLDALHVTPGPFSIFRRSIFKEIGLFRHAHNTEDMEIACRIQTHRYRIANCPRAIVHTVVPDTIKKLHRQRTRWVYGFIKNAMDYRHLFFNRKYGNLGFFTFPFSIVSIVAAFYIVGTTVAHIAENIYLRIDRIRIVGINWSNFHFNWDWFFWSTELTTFLSIILLIISVSMLLIGKYLSEGTAKPSPDILYFLFLYGFIAPFWLGKGVFNSIAARKTPWR